MGTEADKEAGEVTVFVAIACLLSASRATLSGIYANFLGLDWLLKEKLGAKKLWHENRVAKSIRRRTQ
jgi:hypothetical protein